MKPIRRLLIKTALLLALFATTARADEHFAVLKAGSDTYSNVTVMSVSATDIFFTHAQGMGNVKLKSLDPELQKHFHYNQDKAAAAEASHAQANAQFRQQPPSPPAGSPPAMGKPASAEDFIAPQLYAKSVRGQKAPEFVVENWVTEHPDARGKFMLIDFWATWCGPCRHSIPGLNEFSVRFKDRLVVIGISDESEADIRKMTDPHIDYFVASDQQGRMSHELQIKGIPHCILVDPRGIVRYEGMPTFLDDAKLQHFLQKYDW